MTHVLTVKTAEDGSLSEMAAANHQPGERVPGLAAVDEPSAAEPLLLGALAGDPLRAIARLLAHEDRFRARLACTTLRDNCEPPASLCLSRVAFLRTRALAAYACDELAGFLLADRTRMLALAASVGCVGALAELMEARGCGAGADSARACCAAASHGQLEALVWLRDRGCLWDASVCERSAGGGHLELVRYAHENGCPWTEGTCKAAAGGGHLEVLR